jgi:hypothetical protein
LHVILVLPQVSIRMYWRIKENWLTICRLCMSNIVRILIWSLCPHIHPLLFTSDSQIPLKTKPSYVVQCSTLFPRLALQTIPLSSSNIFSHKAWFLMLNLEIQTHLVLFLQHTHTHTHKSCIFFSMFATVDLIVRYWEAYR